jgi:hypothetical protein
MKYFIAILTTLLLTTGIAFAGGNQATSGSESNSGATAIIDNTDASKTNINDRDHMTGGVNVTAQTHALFYKGNGGDVSFRPIKEMLRFGGVFSETALKNLAKGGDVEYNFNVVNKPRKGGNYNKKDKQRYINIVIVEPSNFALSAMVDAEADDNDTNSFQIIAKLALKALDNGDNVLFIEFEGYKDKVNASGWGIGTHTAAGTISESGKNAAIGGGGFGYSNNNVGAEMRPWVRGYAGNQPVLIAGGEMLVPAPKGYQSRQTGNHRNSNR